ncbi:hypothetical protein FA95DRAFT_1612391 [Auriscalpium vulgare]|uniref:Uncharacterized protein n=1 Tax=Auriscalpium vulgare TaxID=40419 RepID=A0ACB8R6B7_9AGAM|nr:hypothetical protein FA95DRAFT_1612391 [Auriscalpium vulgare]
MRTRPGHSGEFALWDWHALDGHIVTREQLMDPSFNVHTWIHHDKAKIEDMLKCGHVTGHPDFPKPVLLDEIFGLNAPSPQFLTPTDDASVERLRTYVRSELLHGAYESGYLLVTDECAQHEYVLPFEEACSLNFCAAFWLEQAYLRLLEVPMDLDSPGDVPNPPRRSQSPMLSSDKENVSAHAEVLEYPTPSRMTIDPSAGFSTQRGRTDAVDVSVLEESVERVDIEEAWQPIPKEELNASGIDDG